MWKKRVSKGGGWGVEGKEGRGGGKGGGGRGKGGGDDKLILHQFPAGSIFAQEFLGQLLVFANISSGA